MTLLRSVKNAILSVHTYLGMEKRTITRKNDEPYLTRYYLFRKPLRWLPSVYLHCFHASDEDQELHNHPWDKSFSIILDGSYQEEYRDINRNVISRTVSPGMFNSVNADKFHRVDLNTPEVWTIFFSGRKPDIPMWGFWNRNTDEYVHWDVHEARKEDRMYTQEYEEKIHQSRAS